MTDFCLVVKSICYLVDKSGAFSGSYDRQRRMVTETSYRGQSKSRAWTRIGMNGERLLSPALRRSRKDVNALLAVLDGDSLKTINHLQQRHQHPGQRLQENLVAFRALRLHCWFVLEKT